MIARGKTLTGYRIQLDGADLQDCTLEQCELHYSGLFGTRVVGCTFSDCSWHFWGAAQEALNFMAVLYHNGAKEMIESTFANIRAGAEGRGPRPDVSG